MPGTASLAMRMLDEGTNVAKCARRSPTSSQRSARTSRHRVGPRQVVRLGVRAEGQPRPVAGALRRRRPASVVSAERLRSPQAAADRAASSRRRCSRSRMALRVLPKLLYGAGHAYGLPFTGLAARRTAVQGRHARRPREVPRDLVQAEQRHDGRRRRHHDGRDHAEARALFKGWKPGDAPAKNVADGGRRRTSRRSTSSIGRARCSRIVARRVSSSRRRRTPTRLPFQTDQRCSAARSSRAST